MLLSCAGDGDVIFVHHRYSAGPGELLEADLYRL